jgi:hypothetical protein
VAWIVVFPAADALASPDELIAAAPGREEDQDTALVDSFVLPSP